MDATACDDDDDDEVSTVGIYVREMQHSLDRAYFMDLFLKAMIRDGWV